jgi:Pex19 protein family
MTTKQSNNLFCMMIAADEERAKLDAALDAALDALDDSEDEEEVDNQHPRDDDNGTTSPTDTLPVRQSLAPSNEANNTPGSNVAASPSVAPSNPVAMGPPRPPDSWSPEKLFEEMMHQMIEGGGNHHADNDNGSSNAMMEDFGKLLAEMQKFEVQEGSSNHSKGKDTPKSNGKAAKTVPTAKPKSTQTKPKSAATASPQRNTDSAAACSSTVPSAAAPADAAAAADQQAVELQAALATMMQGLEQAQQRMAENDHDENNNDASAFNADAVVNGMMEQLLSKDLMYDPMKQVATRFPDWLREHQDRLSATELAEYVFLNTM